MDLIRAARTGRDGALWKLFDEHHSALFRFAYRLTGSLPDAEDIVQECFLALLRPECAYDPSRTSPRTYLFGAVRNQALKRLRKREQEHGCSTEPADGRSPETEALRGELEAAVAHAVGELPESQREVLILSFYEQLPVAEIAEILQIEPGAVKSRLQRARAKLKETLAVFAGIAEQNR
jgi:RNA polymerase sigma-70 factor (ECF subfamily)